VHSFGSGHAYYLAVRAEDSFLVDLYRKIGPASGASPCMNAELPEGVTVMERIGSDAVWIFVQNWNSDQATIILHETLIDAESGATIYGEMVISGYEVKILRRNAAA
jgi:beta-galactosidase